MNFEHTQDRQMLADSLGRFIAQHYEIELRNRIAYGSQGYCPQGYAQLAELGVIGALLPPAVGGYAGQGFDISMIFEALGRGLLTEPVLGAMLVGQALVHAGNEAQRARLQALMDGTVIAAFAHDEPGAHYETANVATRAHRQQDGWRLTGRKAMVPLGERADLILVSARTSGTPFDEDGISLFLLDGRSAAIQAKACNRIEGGRAADLLFDDVWLDSSALLGAEGKGFAMLERLQGYALLALAAESVGVMEVVKEQTLEYLRTRKQFGVPIGSFQALQHRMADLLLEIEQARSAVINAAAAIDGDDVTHQQKLLSAAKYTVGRVGTLLAEESIQMHGGIGVTWELPLSHYAKRLVMIDHQFGDEDHHLERFIQLSTP